MTTDDTFTHDEILLNYRYAEIASRLEASGDQEAADLIRVMRRAMIWSDTQGQKSRQSLLELMSR